MKKNIQLNKLITPDVFGFLVVFVLIIAEHYFELVQIPSWAFTAFSTVIFLICSEEVATRYYIMLVPFANAMHIKEISIFYMAIMLYKMAQKKQKFAFHTGTILAYMVIIFLQLIACVRCDDKLATAVYLLTVMGSVVLWTKLFFEEKTCEQFIKSYLLSFAIMAIFLIMLTIRVVPIDQLIKGYVRLGDDAYFERDVFHTGANGLGMMNLFCASLICYLLYKGRVKKTTAVCGLLLFAITGMMTQSRAFFVGAVFFVLYLTFFCSSSVVRALKILIIVGIVLLIAVRIVNRFYPNLLLRYMARFEVDDISNGRIDILSAYFEKLLDDPVAVLIGVGLSSYWAELGAEISHTAHNATQEVMLAWGIIGLLAVVAWFVSLVKSRGLKSLPGMKMKALMPLFVLLLMVQSSRLFSTFNSIYLVGIAMFCIVPPKNQEGEDNENTVHSTSISYKSNSYCEGTIGKSN